MAEEIQDEMSLTEKDLIQCKGKNDRKRKKENFHVIIGKSLFISRLEGRCA